MRADGAQSQKEAQELLEVRRGGAEQGVERVTQHLLQPVALQ